MVCHNPDAANRDATVCQRLIEHLESLIEGANLLTVSDPTRPKAPVISTVFDVVSPITRLAAR